MHGKISEDIEVEICLDCGTLLKDSEDTLCSDCLHKDDSFYEAE